MLRKRWQELAESTRRQFAIAALLMVLVFCGARAALQYSAPQVRFSPPPSRLATLRSLRQEELARQQVHERARRSIVLVGSGSGSRAGSGWVYDDRGHIVTSARTVAKARQEDLWVRFADHTQAPARIVGVDRGSDLAVLEVRRTPGLSGGSTASYAFPRPLPLASSGASLRVGQEVYALGTATGLECSLSRGMLCGLGTSLGVPGASAAGQSPINCAMLQTDAVVHRGNGGGPLLNSRAEVVGMVVAPDDAIVHPMGMHFAVPIDSVKARVQSILEFGFFRRPCLGVDLAPDGMFSQGAAQSGSSSSGQQAGVVVLNVMPESAAAKAGIRAGDVIVAVDAVPVWLADDVVARLDRHEPGDTARLTILRAREVAAARSGNANALEWWELQSYPGGRYDTLQLDVRLTAESS